jgi:hypothetical protein
MDEKEKIGIVFSDLPKFKTLYYVVCPAFHGATLISCLLNNHQDVTALGDTIPHVKWILENVLCGCRNRINECYFWNKLVKTINPQRKFRDNRLLPLYPVVCRNEKINRYIIKFLVFLSLHISTSIWNIIYKSSRYYADNYLTYYKLACKLQGTKHFIDGQKNLIKIMVMHCINKNSRKIKILHLVRDPRAVYYSHTRRGKDITVKAFCKSWNKYHLNVNVLKSRLEKNSIYLLRYEKFCTAPEKYMTEIQKFFGLPVQDVLHLTTNADMKHIIGNRMIENFNGTVELDTRWASELDKRDQQKIVELTEPLFSYFGYTK